MLRFDGADRVAIACMLDRYGLKFHLIAPHAFVPGSYWGESEAGLVGSTLFARPDTPVHSILHEAAHYVCMSPARRARLETDAGGDFAEESAVCFLQILLAQELGGRAGAWMCRDMDSWGYTFRLGSAEQWFSTDAADARQWLLDYGLIDDAGVPTYRCR